MDPTNTGASGAPDDNPFRPPVADVGGDPAAEPRDLEDASRWRRFLTAVIDYACFYAFSFVIGVVLIVVAGDRVSFLFDASGAAQWALTILLFFLYYLLFEATLARTPGKLLTGTVVVDEAGGRPRFGQVLGRTACRLIPFEPFTFFGDDGLHDRLPGTRVVRVRRDR